MALRQTPEEYFATRTLVHTQEPVHVAQAPAAPLAFPFADPNMMLFILGLVAVVGIIGLFAFLGFSSKRCDK